MKYFSHFPKKKNMEDLLEVLRELNEYEIVLEEKIGEIAQKLRNTTSEKYLYVEDSHPYMVKIYGRGDHVKIFIALFKKYTNVGWTFGQGEDSGIFEFRLCLPIEKEYYEGC